MRYPVPGCLPAPETTSRRHAATVRRLRRQLLALRDARDDQHRNWGRTFWQGVQATGRRQVEG